MVQHHFEVEYFCEAVDHGEVGYYGEVVRHDMESVELHGKVVNIGKVGEVTRLCIILMLHISLKGIFSHPQWVIHITICHLVLMSNDLPKL